MILLELPVMAVQSKLMPSREQTKRLVNAYSAHRPFIQRALLLGFVAHILTTTYLGFNAKPASPKASKKDKGKGKATDTSEGKEQRVAVGY